MHDVLRELGKPGAERIDESVGREVARRAEAKALVLADVRRFGEVYAIDLKVLDPERNEYLLAVKDQSRGKENIPLLIDRLSEKVRAGFGETAAEIRAANIPVARSTTANLEAYRHLFLAEQHYFNMDYVGVGPDLREAIRLDPDFALAHLRLAQGGGGQE